ncbi:hypothetical protein BKA63DRAFT_569851 [Paraphoma chrysanthemicola]|nr:hypothetical protein BKA63DRAFT_569851 [Paraphoma chrysanthemicola]
MTPSSASDHCLPPPWSSHSQAIGSAANLALPSIYSTSPLENHINDNNNHGPARAELSGRQEEFLSNDDTLQMIEIFKEKLLPTALILLPADFENGQTLIETSPDLVACIVFVTSRYVPGYASLRGALSRRLSDFMKRVFDSSARASPAQQMTNLTGLVILYTFTRSNAIEQKPEADTGPIISFWSVKATCETYAALIGAHRSVNILTEYLQSDMSLSRNDEHVQRYLCWVWLFSNSHHTSIATGTPPTLRADAAIRAAPSVLESLRDNPMVRCIVAEAKLCLIWYELGERDHRIKEWWCVASSNDPLGSDSEPLNFVDVDNAISECKKTAWLTYDREREEVLTNSNTDYYLRHSKFCLDTYFIQHIHTADFGSQDMEAIKRCVISALDVLDLSHGVGPALREQLRYLPGFLFVMLSYCASFVLRAFRVFPNLVPDAEAAIETVRHLASFMVELGSHGALAAGRSLKQQLAAMPAATHVEEQAQQPGWMSLRPSHEFMDNGQDWIQDFFVQNFLESSYDFSA